MKVQCPVCHGEGSYLMPGDLHRSEGIVPCTRCNGGFIDDGEPEPKVDHKKWKSYFSSLKPEQQARILEGKTDDTIGNPEETDNRPPLSDNDLAVLAVIKMTGKQRMASLNRLLDRDIIDFDQNLKVRVLK